jgi:hypothetical protein
MSKFCAGFRASLVIFSFLSFFSIPSLSQEVEKHMVETSTNENLGLAREEILAKSLQKASEELILQLIGRDSFNQNLKSVQQITTKETGKFIPSYRTSDLQTQNGVSQMKVSMRISLDQLKELLISRKLLQRSQGGVALRIRIQNTEGFVMIEALKNELLARFPEIGKMKVRTISAKSIEFTAEIENESTFQEIRTIQLLNRKAEVLPIEDSVVEIQLSSTGRES